MITIKWTKKEDLETVEELLAYLDPDNEERFEKLQKKLDKHGLPKRTKQKVKKDMKDKAKNK